jgi:hypothetical protein
MKPIMRAKKTGDLKNFKEDDQRESEFDFAAPK